MYRSENNGGALRAVCQPAMHTLIVIQAIGCGAFGLPSVIDAPTPIVLRSWRFSDIDRIVAGDPYARIDVLPQRQQK